MPNVGQAFDYHEAFSRNIGWLTEWEQAALRHKTVAIAGMGGVGGIYLTTLTRLGVGGFNIADLDSFELANFNRQQGATVSSLGERKVEAMARLARDINPELRLKTFDSGITEDNIDTFLEGADLFLDGFDFFELTMRSKVFARCRVLGIPAVTAAPLGMGTAYLVFTPDGMSFEDYFQVANLPTEKQYVNFVLGLGPKGYQMRYLVDPSRADFERRTAPSTPMSVTLCAGVVGVETLKLLLGRGRVRPAPWSHHFDAYLGRWAARYVLWGNRNPLQALKRHIGYQRFSRFARLTKVQHAPAPRSEIETILDLARWAPSGDNTQPWRFAIKGEDAVSVYVRDQSDHDVYDYNEGQPSLISAGCLVESMAIAASDCSRSLAWRYRREDAHTHRLDVKLTQEGAVPRDPLIAYLPMRTVCRGPLSSRALSPETKAELDAALGSDLELYWHEDLGERWQMARLNAMATRIRLSIPEALPVHREIIDWTHRFSPDKIPAAATGLDPLARKIMKWALEDKTRFWVMNQILGGIPLAQLEMDLLPGLFCGAHFTIAAREQSSVRDGSEFLIDTGRRIQRFWLTATRENLSLQPAIAPLIFGFYGRHDIPFTENSRMQERAGKLAGALGRAYGPISDKVVFRGRLGQRKARVTARSVRKSLEELGIPYADAE